MSGNRRAFNIKAVVIVITSGFEKVKTMLKKKTDNHVPIQVDHCLL